VGAALGAVALPFTLLPSSASAAGTSTVIPITTFGVTSSQCDGPMTSPLINGLIADLDAVEGPKPTVPLLFPYSCAAPSSLLALLASSSTTAAGSSSGSATVTAQADGNPLIGESASSDVVLTAAIPLSSPASSVEVTIPYTTSGVTGGPNNVNDTAGGLLIVGPLPVASAIMCADGSQGTISPINESGDVVLFPIGTPVGPGSGTFDNIIRFYCPDGSDLVSGVGFAVTVADDVISQSGQAESATANFEMHGVTATADS
jgi:hypothetical protein